MRPCRKTGLGNIGKCDIMSGHKASYHRDPPDETVPAENPREKLHF